MVLCEHKHSLKQDTATALRGPLLFSHHVLTILASAQPSSDCYGDVELLPFSKWEEFKLFYGSHTFLHLVSYTQPGRNTRLRDGTERTHSANRVH